MSFWLQALAQAVTADWMAATSSLLLFSAGLTAAVAAVAAELVALGVAADLAGTAGKEAAGAAGVAEAITVGLTGAVAVFAAIPVAAGDAFTALGSAMGALADAVTTADAAGFTLLAGGWLARVLALVDCKRLSLPILPNKVSWGGLCLTLGSTCKALA